MTDAALLRSMRKFVAWYRENTDEGRTPIEPDPGCVDCTCGTTPDRYNTGLCMYHRAERLIAEAGK